MRIQIRVAALVLCTACARPAPELSSRPAGAAVVVEDTARALVALLRRAVEHDSAARAAWPGFGLRDHVLIVAAQPSGPAALVGDAAPPADYVPVDTARGIFLRLGPPPDSLSGMRVALPWDGAPARATAVSYRGENETLPILVHEAFHTFQDRVGRERPGSFHSGATPDFPDTLAELVGLLNLESDHLARAVTAPTAGALRRHALAALAVRTRRCALLGEAECDTERDIEQNEGTAQYVTALVLAGHAPRGHRVTGDSLVRALAPLRELSRLGRWHFYDTGHAWVLLLARLAPPEWQRLVERTPPDRVLAAHLGFTPMGADSLFAALVDSADATKYFALARQLVNSELATRDSVHRAFWSRPGVPVRLYGKSLSSIELTPEPGATPQSFRVRAATGELVRYSVGVRESTMRFGDGANWVRTRGPTAHIGGESPAVVVLAPVAGAVAFVNERPVPLDQRGAVASGAVRLSLPGVDLAFEQAELRVYADSVTVRLR